MTCRSDPSRSTRVRSAESTSNIFAPIGRRGRGFRAREARATSSPPAGRRPAPSSSPHSEKPLRSTAPCCEGCSPPGRPAGLRDRSAQHRPHQHRPESAAWRSGTTPRYAGPVGRGVGVQPLRPPWKRVAERAVARTPVPSPARSQRVQQRNSPRPVRPIPSPAAVLADPGSMAGRGDAHLVAKWRAAAPPPASAPRALRHRRHRTPAPAPRQLRQSRHRRADAVSSRIEVCTLRRAHWRDGWNRATQAR